MDATLPFAGYIIAGLEVTIIASMATFAAAAAIGLAFALWSAGDSAVARRFVRFYIAVFRSLPELLCIFIVYFGVDLLMRRAGAVMGVTVATIPPLIAVTIALGLQFGAYCTEIFADARASLSRGLFEAAEALGLPPREVTTRVAIPLMMQVAIPGLGNIFLVILKVTALASVIGLEEVTRRAKIVAGSTREPFAAFAIASLCFLALTAGAAVAQALLERSTRRARGVA